MALSRIRASSHKRNNNVALLAVLLILIMTLPSDAFRPVPRSLLVSSPLSLVFQTRLNYERQPPKPSHYHQQQQQQQRRRRRDQQPSQQLQQQQYPQNQRQQPTTAPRQNHQSINQAPAANHRPSKQPRGHSADKDKSSSSSSSVTIDIVQVGRDEASVCQAASFLVNAFWLDPRHLVGASRPLRRYPDRYNRSRTSSNQNSSSSNNNNNNNNNQYRSNRNQEQQQQSRFANTYGNTMSTGNVNNIDINTRNGGNNNSQMQVSSKAKKNLFQAQATDLMERYGEIMPTRRGHKPLLDNCILKAVDVVTGATLGLLCVSALLFDTKTEELLLHADSEEILQSALETLKPRDRRRYQSATAEQIATGLLGGEMVAVCCISNLAVSPQARRMGIAAELCDEAERVARYWGYDAVLLKVEADNHAARHLYERKLGYRTLCKEVDAGAFRVDTRDGRFVETRIDTFVLAKDI